MINHLLLGAGAAVVAVALSAPVIVSSRHHVADRQPRPAVASVANSHPAAGASRAEPDDDAGFLGVVVALQSVELSAKFDGTVERLDVHVGDHVRGGTIIARLDSRSAARDLAIAEAALRVAEADHQRLLIEMEDASGRRARLQSIPELVARDQIASAQSQEDVARARLRGAAAELAAKLERKDQLGEMLRDVQIVAPFDGTIASRYVDPGATVSRSTPIVRVISPTSLVIRFAVPEERATGLAVGRHVAVRVGSGSLSADAVIERMVPEIDAALRMVVFEARLADGGGRMDTIPAGAIARVYSFLSTGDGRTGHERSIH